MKELKITYESRNGKTYASIKVSKFVGKDASGKNKYTSYNLYSFGCLEKFKELYPNNWEQKMEEILLEKQKEYEMNNVQFLGKLYSTQDFEKGEKRLFHAGHLYFSDLLEKIKLKKELDNEKSETKVEYDYARIILDLVYSQVLKPGSKLSAYNSKESLLLCEGNYSERDMYRALNLLAKNADKINAFTYSGLQKYTGTSTKIYYYDCTDFYYQTDIENDMSKFGKSKEGIYAPLINMGLLIDEYGLIVGATIYKNEHGEQETLKKTISRLNKHVDLTNIVVCTDAGLSSGDNRHFCTRRGRNFICTHSLKKSKPYIKNFALEDANRETTDENSSINSVEKLEEAFKNASDSKEISRLKNIVLYKKKNINDTVEYTNDSDERKKEMIEQTLIITYSLKYKLMQQKEFEKIEQKIQEIVEKPAKFDQFKENDARSYLKVVPADKKTGEVNSKEIIVKKDKINDTKKWFGYYCTATSLNDDPLKIIGVNHYRWQIEYLFRTMKSELMAMPMWVRTENSIKGHFEIVVLALNLIRGLHLKLYRENNIDGKIGNHYYDNTLNSDDIKKQEIIKSELTEDKLFETLRDIKMLAVKLDTGTAYLPTCTKNFITEMLVKITKIDLVTKGYMKENLRKITVV